MTFDKNYNIEKDIYVKDYFNEKDDLRKDTVSSYKNSIKQFSDANKETIKNIVENCREQQKSRVGEDGGITEFNPNQPDSLIKEYLNNFKEYCIKRGNKNSTINDKMENIFVFLNHYEIKLPRRKKLDNDRKKWYKLSKEDVRYVLKDCNVVEKGFITFMISTGLRRWDVSELTIGDFMEATHKMDYHNFVDIDDFIDNAPDDMIGFWDLIPHKESRNEIPCKTFNSPESSNLILQNLRRIKNEYMPKKSKKEKIELKLEKGDALFGSRKKYYKGPLTKESMTNAIRDKNPRFKEWKIKQIDEDIKNKKISKEDREKKIKEIPIVNPHALRKIFTNAVDTHGGLSLRANLVMEGHSSKVPTDPHYLQKQKDELFTGYKRILPHLTIMEDIEVRLLTNEDSEELNNQIKDLQNEKEDLEKQLKQLKEEKNSEISKLQKQADEQKTRIEKFEKEIEEKLQNLQPLPHLNHKNPVFKSIADAENDLCYIAISSYVEDCYFKKEDNLTTLNRKIQSFTEKEARALIEIAYDISVTDEKFKEAATFIDMTFGREIDDDFKESNIKPLIQKAIVKMTANPQLAQDTIKYFEERNLNKEKLMKYNKLLKYELDKMGIYEQDEVKNICNEISIRFSYNADKVLMKDITQEMVLEDIEKYI